MIDSRGGKDSASIARFVGATADEATKRRQLYFNGRSGSAVFLRMLAGLASSSGESDLPGREEWTGCRIPMLCLAGQADQICPRHNVDLIAKWFDGEAGEAGGTDSGTLPLAAGDVPINTGAASQQAKTEQTATVKESAPSTNTRVVVLPSPAAHGMLYDTVTGPEVIELVEGFLQKEMEHSR